MNLKMLLVGCALSAAPAFAQEDAKAKLTVPSAGVTNDEDANLDPPYKISGNAKTVKHVCAKGKSYVQVSGNANKVTLTGACAKVALSGNTNTVTVESVGILVVTGNANTAEYKNGLDGKPPKITESGNANKVSKTR